MTVFARCHSGHWNAFTYRISLTAVPRQYYYCGDPACKRPFAEPIVFEEDETPSSMPVVRSVAKIPLYYRCALGHDNFEPYDRVAGSLAALECGMPTCQAPITRQRGTPAPSTGMPLYEVRVALAPSVLFFCHSGHISFLNVWTHNHNYQNLACGHSDCLNPMRAHCSRNEVNPLPAMIPVARQFNFMEALQGMLLSLKTIDGPVAAVSRRFEDRVILHMEAPDFFSALCKFSIHKFTDTAGVALCWDNCVYAEMTAPHFMKSGEMHAYCYPVTPMTGVRTTSSVTYADIGSQLCRLSPDMIDMLLTVVLKVIKMKDNKDEDIASIACIRNNEFFVASPHPTRWNTLSLLAVLIGSAACETGRGVVGYVNVVAAFHHLKHDARRVWNEWAMGRGVIPITASQNAVASVYSNNYDLTGNEPKRNSVGFQGSEGLIKRESGRAVYLSQNSADHADAYRSYLQRDVALLARWRSPQYPVLGARNAQHDNETPEQTYLRKIIGYLRILFQQR
jgi:hypothetical protein